MTTFQFSETKRYFWIKSENQSLCRKISGGEWHPTEVVGASRWETIEAVSIDEAIRAAFENRMRQSEERKARNQSINEAAKAEMAAFEQLMASGAPIEATIENIGNLLRWLNSQNWGTWALPKMTIGYSAHQYDCDGRQATTITLDRPVDGSRKYEVGAPNGHLVGYKKLR